MKKILYITLLSITASLFMSCEYDNYDEPESNFTGRIVYNGEPIGVDYNATYIELWEQGWQLKAAIKIVIGLDGTFSEKLFDGTYKMVLPKGQGPYVFTNKDNPANDTVDIVLKGDKNMDIEVMPYHLVRNPQYRYNKEKNVVEAQCSIEQIITDPALAKDVELIRVYIGKTAFLYNGSHIAYQTLNPTNNPGGSLDNVLFTGPSVGTLSPKQNYVFARIGVKTKGVEDWMVSPVQKVMLD